MTNLCGFGLAAFPLLIAPGPTNALLAACGATAGLRRSVPLVAAAPLGYAVTVTTLAALVVPLTRHSSAAGAALSIGCGLYLAYTAWKLWTELLPGRAEAAAGFGQVLTATLTNPKGLVVALVMLPRPPEGAGLAASAPFIVAVMALSAGAGAAWIAAGALVRTRLRGSNGSTVRKTSSVVLAGFAVALLIVGVSRSVGWALPVGSGEANSTDGR